MSNIVYFTIFLFVTKVRSLSRQSVYEDFPTKFLSHHQSFRKIETVESNTLDFQNNVTKMVSEGRFTHPSFLCADRELKSNKFNLLNTKTMNLSINSLNICKETLLNGFDENAKSAGVLPWYFEVFRGIYYILKSCQSESDCFRKRIIQGMDRMIETESVKLADGIFLVKNQMEEVSTMPRDSEREPFIIAVARRIIQVLETHDLRVRLGIMNENVAQARIGHHGYKHAFPLMVGSFMLLASFMVPMGFQFLAVVGGKALVLSQIALVMAMGSTLQRFFGIGNQKQGNVGGIVQHEYYVKDDIQPWQRQGSEDKHQMNNPHRQVPDHHQPQQLTHHQLQGLMNYHQS